MQIIYLGHSSFKIKTKTADIVCDPYSRNIGFNFVKTKADIVTISHGHFDHNNLKGIKNDDYFLITGPGEYEIKEVMIKGIKTYHDEENGQKRGGNTVYVIQAEDINICHLGDLGHELSDKEINELEDIEVLLIPVGGTYTLDPRQAIKVIKKIEPSIVIPMHYKEPGMIKDFEPLVTVREFFEAMELEFKQEERLTLSYSTLPEETEVIALQRKV